MTDTRASVHIVNESNINMMRLMPCSYIRKCAVSTQHHAKREGRPSISHPRQAKAGGKIRGRDARLVIPTRASPPKHPGRILIFPLNIQGITDARVG